MHSRIKLIALVLLTLVLFTFFFGAISFKTALANTFQVSGTVTDSSNNPVSGVQVGDPYDGFATTTNANGFYSMSVQSVATTMEFINREASSSMPNSWFLTLPINLQGATTFNVQIPSNTLTVHVLDPNGNPLPNATVYVLIDENAIPIQTSQGIVTGRIDRTPSGEQMINGVNTDSQGNMSGIVLRGTRYAFRGDAPNSKYLSFEYPLSVSSDTSKTYVFNSPPVVSGVANATLNQGDIYSLNGSSLSHNVTTQTATVDYGDGSGTQTLTLTQNGNTPLGFGLDDFTLNHTYNTAGVYTVTVRVSDVGGSTGIATATIMVTVNAPPNINTFRGATINEGDTYTASSSFTDTDSTSWTATVDYGDGSGVQPLTLSGMNFSLSHQYKDEGTYTVTVKVTDNQGATGTGTATITVNNATPTVGAITAPATIGKNASFTASANFTDPGVLDTHTASWNWGDGNTTTGTVTESNGSGSVSNTHTYVTAGSFTITLSVTDDKGLTGTGQVTVAVSPSGSGSLSGVNLTGLNYNGANLSNQNISGSNLKNGTFTDTNFQNANLSGVDAKNVSFQNANFTGANLAGSNFSGANFTNANMTGANLTGANFKSAIMTGVTWSNTICPDGTNSNNDGGTCIGHGGGL